MTYTSARAYTHANSLKVAVAVIVITEYRVGWDGAGEGERREEE